MGAASAVLQTMVLASCLTNAQPLPAHGSVADNSLNGCTNRELTDDWSLASTHFVDSQYAFRCSFGCVLLLNQMF